MWLYGIFLGQYLQSLIINYFAINKDIEKRLPQLYNTKMEIYYQQCYDVIRVFNLVPSVFSFSKMEAAREKIPGLLLCHSHRKTR